MRRVQSDHIASLRGAVAWRTALSLCLLGFIANCAHREDATVVEGSQLPADPREAVEWRFDEPRSDWKPVVVPAVSPTAVERVADALRVTLVETPNGAFRGGVYVELPDWHEDAWSQVVVRARTSSNVRNIGIGRNRAELGPGEPLAAPLGRLLGGSPPVPDGLVHTYQIPLEQSDVRRIPWQRLGLWVQGDEPGSIDILSVSVVPTLGTNDLAVEQQKRVAARADGSMLSVFDREGRLVRTIGERDLYRTPVFSPDETRVAVVIDYQGNADLWVLDVDSGEGTRIASVITDELTAMASFVWSPDGSQLAYVALRGSYYGIYRKSATGEGEEELLYRHPGTPLLTDWSRDGRYLGFFTWEAPGGTMAVLPVDGVPAARVPIEILASESASLTGPYFSPEGRFVAYQSAQSGRASIWVRSFDPGRVLPEPRAWEVSDGDVRGSFSDWYGVFGRIVWPDQGPQLYYVSANLDVMAVDVAERPDFVAGRPRLLFTAPPMAELSHVSADGRRFLIAVPPPRPLNQIVMFDRAGRELGSVGEPGLYRSAAPSPDGSKVAVVRLDAQTGREEIWTFDVSTGEAVQVTTPPDMPHNDLIEWTPDGSHVAYPAEPCDTDLYCELYQRAWNGEGDRELLFRFTEPGAPLESLNFSLDGRFVSFQSGAALFTVALAGSDPLAREAVAFPADEFGQFWPTFSPDSRFIAYMSTESGGADYYVRPFDAATGIPGEEQWRITTHGPSVGGSAWRPDGREILYTRRLNGSGPPEGPVEVMAIEVTTTPRFEAGEPRVLFTLPELVPRFTARASQSFTSDGEVFVALVAVPAP